MKAKSATFSIQALVERYATHPLLPRLREQISTMEVLGLTGSAPACVVAALSATMPILVIAQEEQEAGYWYSDLTRLLPDTAISFFPSGYSRHIKYGKPDAAFGVMRSETLTALASGHKPLIVTYPEALAEAVPLKSSVAKLLISLRKGHNCRRDQLREQLLEWGFVQTDYVYEPGQIAFRGSIVDVFSFHNDTPVRVDFMDDEVESLRFFDVESQLSVQEVDEVQIVPAFSEQSTPQKTSFLTDLPQEYRIWLRDADQTLSRVREVLSSRPVVEDEDVSGKSLSAYRRLLVDSQVTEKELKQRVCVLLRHSGDFEVFDSLQFETSAQPLLHKNFDLLVQTMASYKEERYDYFFLSDSPAQADRLVDILAERGRGDLSPLRIPAVLSGGFEDRSLHLSLLTDHQIFDRFHKYNLKSDRLRNVGMAITLQDLNNFHLGDFIVHSDHGVGQFDGLVTMELAGKPQEVVKLVYRDGDTIFVNLHSLHKLSKYRGRDEVPPQLNKIGTGAWLRLKERTKKKIKDIARDLIALYAARKEKEGFAFSADSYLQHELEASFMYEDTPDQLAATQSVKKDMESRRPMDRLICGDVGFGKTEIAVRAAFKAVADNKQVAVLVPTTILAYQHYQTFSSRLRDFPCRIEYVSRAKSTKQIKQIIEELKQGKIDIVIGTHRLVSKDVHFKDLGLLIIDEEQKFGVAVKEKLRHLQVNVDTLTLSATPIPRTLQFSLMGARDLSNINTPPRNRLPVSTQVVRFSKEILREAIEFELSRNGQVYVVHNRIHDIDDLRYKIAEAVPEARIAVGHGRMAPAEMEQLLLDFSRHEYDVLIATSIVENGIDVSNANTIIIDNAHRFGLSDLHQLRGRVGRSNRKAFCYLITPPLDALPEDARRRINAIETFSELGSGMRIAMQDLDIRGAGNILGAEQSGFIADLGFETYRKVFDEAVREVKMEEYPDLFTQEEIGGGYAGTEEATVETDLDLSFPPLYVPQDGERINLYRRIDNLQSLQQQQEFARELGDRFGLPLPQSVSELLLVPQLRRLGTALGVIKVVLRKGIMTLHLPTDSRDPYYDSELFSRLLAYLSRHLSSCELKENAAGKRLVRMSGVESVARAVEQLTEVVGWSETGE